MDKESAEFIKNMYQFLKGKELKHNSTNLYVEDVVLEQNSDGWQPTITAKEIQGDGSAVQKIILDNKVRTELSVLLAEVDTLQYDEKGCSRLHLLLQEIYREIPIKEENYKILDELKPYLGYWASWDDRNKGREEFDHVKNLLCTDLKKLL